MPSDQPILLTGAAGFIGYHVAERLLAEGELVVGVDNLSDYYDVGLKRARLARLAASSNFEFIEADISDRVAMPALFSRLRPASCVHLAAQAGVRYSLEHPHAYLDANLAGTLNILEGCRHNPVSHLVYASSSSVYGSNTVLPFSVRQGVDHPLSLYAATKKANEMMAHSYSHLYGIPTTGLRFFTVYGPWGRPDMAMFIFAKAILAGRPIQLFNHGEMLRDFTYIDDIVEGVVTLLRKPPAADPSWDAAAGDPGTSAAPYRVFNIGNHRPVKVPYVIELLEKELGVKAVIENLPMQAGDVPATFADIDDLHALTGFWPRTNIEEGIKRFAAWYLTYFRG
jgi:UDP-glucuronate 4-epimerase